jgi:glycine hydroxymethyltransferase
MDYSHIQQQDLEVFGALEGEETREREGLELIPSENYVSRAVREASGSILTNKYAEGYPGRRYYGGQEFTDAVETLAINRAKQLFDCDHANVQPLGGAAANIAAYFAWMEPGDTILGMDLGHGGHLTHGSPVTYMARLYNFVRYKMKDVETGEIDYEDMMRVAKETRPKIVLAGFSGYSRELGGCHGRCRAHCGAYCRRRTCQPISFWISDCYYHHAQNSARPSRWDDTYQRYCFEPT